VKVITNIQRKSIFVEAVSVDLMLSQASPEEVERPHEKSDRIFGNRAEI
jgi:hypothetical protein